MKYPTNSATIEFTTHEPVVHGRGNRANLSKAVLRATYERSRQLLADYEEYRNSEHYHYSRIKAFMDKLGLPTIDLYFLDEAQVYEMAHLLQEETHVPTPMEESVQGFFYTPHNIAGVKTGGKREATNPRELIESFGVHEAGHAAGLIAASNMVGHEGLYRLYSTRSGFRASTSDYQGARRDRGQFLEEAFCELLRGLFVHKALNRPNGFADNSKLDRLKLELSEDGIVCPPYKYFYNSYEGNGEFELTRESLAGFALELLILENPELAKKLIDARKSSSGLREFYRTMEDAHPGILRDLNELASGTGSLIDGFTYVCGIVNPAVIKSYNPEDVARLFGL